jgi:hypothetical protein
VCTLKQSVNIGQSKVIDGFVFIIMCVSFKRG